MLENLQVRKSKSSCLFLESRRKSIHLPGNFSPYTLASLFSSRFLQAVHKLCIPTTSTLSARCNCFCRYGINILSPYSSNVLTPEVDRICTMAAPCIQYSAVVTERRVCLTRLFRASQQFKLRTGQTKLGKVGGKRWIWWAKSSKSLSLLCIETLCCCLDSALIILSDRIMNYWIADDKTYARMH